MHAIIVKRGFVISFILLQHLFIQKPCNIDFGSCWWGRLYARVLVRTMGAWTQCPQLLGNSCNFFRKKHLFNAIWMAFCTLLEQLETAKLLRFGRV